LKKPPHLPRNQLVVQSSRRGGPKSNRYCRQLPTRGPYNSSLLLIKNKHIWRVLLPSRRITMTSRRCELSRFIYKSMAPRSVPRPVGAAQPWTGVELLRRGPVSNSSGAAGCSRQWPPTRRGVTSPWPAIHPPQDSGTAREAPPTHGVELPQHNATVARGGPRRR
jgi:hypothetical protein